MSVRRWSVVGGGVVGALGVAVVTWLAFGRSGRSDWGRGAAHGIESRGSRAGAARAFRFAWPLEQRIVYGFDWSSQSLAIVPGVSGGAATPAPGAIELAGDFALHSRGLVGAEYLLELEIVALRKRLVRVLGSDLFPKEEAANEALLGRRAVVAIAPDGAVRAVYFPKDAPAIFKALLQGLVAEIEVRYPADAGAQWTVVQPGPSGRAETRYALHPTVAGALTRSRARYDELAALPPNVCAGCPQELSASADVLLDPMGHVRALQDDETLVVRDASATRTEALRAHQTFALERKDVGTARFAAALDLASLVALTPGQLVDAEDTERRMLEEAAAGVTMEHIESIVEDFMATGALPGEKVWLGRVAAFLKLHPTYCDDLVKLFRREGVDGRGQGVILDMLVGAGHARAQAAMRAALDSPGARSDPRRYLALIQRFSFLDHPDDQSAAYVARIHDAARAAGDHDLEQGSLYALGSVAGGLARDGKPEARVYNERLVAGLHGAKTAEDRQDHLVALGNAGVEENVGAIRAYTKDPSARVRGQVATSVRKSKRKEARETLLDLMGDDDPHVQKTAMQVLVDQPLESDDLRRLADAVIAGGTSPANEADLTKVLAAHARDGVDLSPALEAIYSRTRGTNNRVHAQVKRLLKQAGGGPAAH